MADIRRLEIRPGAQKAALLGLGCAAFTLACLWMAAAGEGEEVLVGLLGAAFFGGIGVFAVRQMTRRKMSLVLTADALEHHYPEGTTRIPWADVECIGIFKQHSNKIVGVRLSTYDTYLQSMPSELTQRSEKMLPIVKWMARGSSVLDVPASVAVWTQLEGGDLESLGPVKTVAQAMLWSRTKYGYDLGIGWAELDRPAEEFVTLLEGYRNF